MSGNGKTKFDGLTTSHFGTSSLFVSNTAKKNVDVRDDMTTKKLAESVLEADDAAPAIQVEEMKSEQILTAPHRSISLRNKRN